MTQRKYRARIVDRNGNENFLTVYDGAVQLSRGDGTPLGLSTIAGKNAMRLRFALEDAETLDAAIQALRCLTSATVEAC